MKFTILFIPVFMISLLFWSCSEEPTSVIQNAENILLKSGPSANGQGALILNGERQTFSFHAIENDGIVTGSIQCIVRNSELIFHGEINCMVIDGNSAIISGEIIHDNGLLELYPDYPYFLFKVIDNGEGANNPPDEFSDIWAYIDYYPCNWSYPPEIWQMQPIENGNIQVKSE